MAAVVATRPSRCFSEMVHRRVLPSLQQSLLLVLVHMVLQPHLALGARAKAPAPQYMWLTQEDARQVRPPADRSRCSKRRVSVQPSPLKDPRFRVVAVGFDDDSWQLWSWAEVFGDENASSVVSSDGSATDDVMEEAEVESSSPTDTVMEEAEAEPASSAATRESPPALSVLPTSVSFSTRRSSSIAQSLRAVAEFVPKCNGGNGSDGWRAAVLLGDRPPIVLSVGVDRPTQHELLEFEDLEESLAFTAAVGVAFFPDVERVVSWQHTMVDDGSAAAAIWRTSDGALLTVLPTPPALQSISGFVAHRAVRVTPKGDKLLILFSSFHTETEHWCAVYDTTTWTEEKVVKLQVEEAQRLTAFESTEVMASLGDSAVVILDREYGGWTIIEVDTDAEFSLDWAGGVPLCVSQDGEYIFQVNGVHVPDWNPIELQVRETWTGKIMHRLHFDDVTFHIRHLVRMQSHVVRAQFSPDGGKVLIFTQNDNALQLVWDLGHGERDGLPVWGPERDGPRFLAKFSMNGEFVIMTNRPCDKYGTQPLLFIHDAASGRLVKELAVPVKGGTHRRRRTIVGIALDALERAPIPRMPTGAELSGSD